jgi:endonuclease/exonuclease/phosphatase family metal-dependent hydrolase
MSLQRSALEGVVETGRGLVRVYSLHLTHLSAETRMPQVERLLEIHEQAPVEGAALSGGGLKDEWIRDGLAPALPREAILVGDFNMEPDSREYTLLAGPVSPYGGRITNPHGFVDAWVAAGHAESDGVTADIDGREVRLDYCFVSASLADAIGSARIDEQAAGSDHQPLWVDMNLD